MESDVISDHVVTVISIKSVPPVTPGGTKIQLTMKNNSAKLITSLNATLQLNNSYVFNFKNVTSLKPLTSSNSVSDTELLIGSRYRTELEYPLIISGIADAVPFSYTVNVTIIS